MGPGLVINQSSCGACQGHAQTAEYIFSRFHIGYLCSVFREHTKKVFSLIKIGEGKFDK